MEWNIPLKKALRSLPFYLLIPCILWFFYTVIIDTSWIDNLSQYWALLRIMLFVWIVRQIIRFLVFIFKRNRIQRII